MAEKTYRTWSSPILLELKAREHQLEPAARQGATGAGKCSDRKKIAEHRQPGRPGSTHRRQASLTTCHRSSGLNSRQKKSQAADGRLGLKNA
jgi:hypothetical protein